MAESAQKFFFLDLWTPAKIEGGSLKTGHVHWLELDDWDFSMHQHVDSGQKAGTPGATSALGTFGFSITHNGPSLFQLAASAKHFTTPVTFEAERAGLSDGSSQVYFRLVFNDWVLHSRSISGDHAVKQEHVEIIFGAVSMNYRQVVNGMLGSAVPMAYNVTTNAAT